MTLMVYRLLIIRAMQISSLYSHTKIIKSLPFILSLFFLIIKMEESIKRIDNMLKVINTKPLKCVNSSPSQTCDICYKEIKEKVTLECRHELCIMCFLEMTTSSERQIIPFKCHMCRRHYNWKKETVKSKEITLEDTLEERLELLIREDNENQFIPLVGINSKAFEVIINRQSQNIIQFIVITVAQIDTETLKFLKANSLPRKILLEVFGGIMFNIHPSVTLEISIRIWNHSMTILLLRNMSNGLGAKVYIFFYLSLKQYEYLRLLSQ